MTGRRFDSDKVRLGKTRNDADLSLRVEDPGAPASSSGSGTVLERSESAAAGRPLLGAKSCAFESLAKRSSFGLPAKRSVLGVGPRAGRWTRPKRRRTADATDSDFKRYVTRTSGRARPGRGADWAGRRARNRTPLLRGVARAPLARAPLDTTHVRTCAGREREAQSHGCRGSRP